MNSELYLMELRTIFLAITNHTFIPENKSKWAFVNNVAETCETKSLKSVKSAMKTDKYNFRDLKEANFFPTYELASMASEWTASFPGIGKWQAACSVVLPVCVDIDSMARHGPRLSRGRPEAQGSSPSRWRTNCRCKSIEQRYITDLQEIVCEKEK